MGGESATDRSKTAVRKAFGEGLLEPNEATIQLLRLDRRARRLVGRGGRDADRPID